MKSQKYNVGDTVVVAKFKNCVFGVDPNMRKYIGQHVHITRAEWSNTYNAWHYSISEDRGNWWWSDECFDYVLCYDLPDFDVSGELSDLLF